MKDTQKNIKSNSNLRMYCSDFLLSLDGLVSVVVEKSWQVGVELVAAVLHSWREEVAGAAREPRPLLWRTAPRCSPRTAPLQPPPPPQRETDSFPFPPCAEIHKTKIQIHFFKMYVECNQRSTHAVKNMSLIILIWFSPRYFKIPKLTNITMYQEFRLRDVV